MRACRYDDGPHHLDEDGEEDEADGPELVGISEENHLGDGVAGDETS